MSSASTLAAKIGKTHTHTRARAHTHSHLCIGAHFCIHAPNRHNTHLRKSPFGNLSTKMYVFANTQRHAYSTQKCMHTRRRIPLWAGHPAAENSRKRRRYKRRNTCAGRGLRAAHPARGNECACLSHMLDVYVNICICMCMYVHTYVCMHVCVYVCAYIHKVDT